MQKIGDICLIDDDIIHLQVARLMIERHEIAEKISSFQEADVALDHIRQHLEQPQELPDMILLDLNMPVMDGWEFLDEMTLLKPLYPKPLRIYIVSSSPDEADIARAKTYEIVTGYLVKPLTSDIILSLAQNPV